MMSNKISLLTALLLSLHSVSESVFLDRLVDRKESCDCPTLCDDNLKVNAITGINCTPELLLISGECAFIVDPTLPPSKQRRHGFKHLLPFSEVQDMFAIRNNADIEFVTVYVSLQ